MASYIQKQQQGQAQVQAPVAPAAPAQSLQIEGGISSPQDNPVSSVANFQGGNDLPGGGIVGANSQSAGGNFGYRFADPAAAAGIAAGLSNYHYSLPAGGYLHNDYPATATHREGSFYKGGNPPANRISPLQGGGGDPNANRAVGDIYSELGNLPRVENTTGALNKLNAATGATPSAGPTINDTLRTAGVNSPWGGPWEFPGWHLGP
jgi:hypothetical protein